MYPRIILYTGLLLLLIPLWGMSVYVEAFRGSTDIDMMKFFADKIAMIGMFSWPLWLGLPFFTLFKRRYLKIPEIIIAFVPMALIFGVYYSVIFSF